ncbi:MAG: tetratricopeptide repeat protein [Gammaproteobacteria bacterium]
MVTDLLPTDDEHTEPELPVPDVALSRRAPAHLPLSSFARPLDDEEFTTVRNLAGQGDLDAMVDYALELRRRGAEREARGWLTRAARAGDERAVAELVDDAPTADSGDGDSHGPLDWVKRAAEGGNLDCMLILARACRDGAQGQARDFRQMLRWALRAAQARSAEAMRMVSDAYALGQGVPQDAARALVWLKRAAMAGDATAIQRLADRSLGASGVPRDASNYFAWTRKGAETGDATLMFNLAEAYREGLGTEIDHAAFFRWINKAADRGHPAALHRLALAYRDGIGVKPDPAEYWRLITRAAEVGDPPAMNTLALGYLHGEGVPVDARRHVELLTRAAKSGEPSAMFNLAHAYRDGAGVERDAGQYKVWLEQAVRSRDRHAQVELAAQYFREALDKRRAGKAEQSALDLRFQQLATTAAEAGDARAMYLLAMAYRLGVGVLSDVKRAREWTESAAHAGLPVAMLDFADFCRNDRGSDPDGHQYFTWLERAAGADDLAAKRRLALAYHDGLGTTRDLEACRRWLEAAARGGDQAAFVLLGLIDLEREGALEAAQLHAALEPFMNLQAEVDRIKTAQLVREAPEGAAYFLSGAVLRTLLDPQTGEHASNRLRLYNAAYLSDTDDGRFLFARGEAPGARLLRGFLPQERARDWPLTTPWDGREYSVYLASFHLRADYLDLWRAEGGEGSAVCIVTPLAAFAQDRERLPFVLTQGAGRALPPVVPPVLYRVEYDPAMAARVLKSLEPHLVALQAFKDTLKTGGPIVDALVRILVLQILYLFKPEAYAGEREARMVASFDIDSAAVRHEETPDSGRLYVETEPFLLATPGSQVLVGPAVKERAAAYLDLRYRLARSRWARATRVSYSAIELR